MRRTLRGTSVAAVLLLSLPSAVLAQEDNPLDRAREVPARDQGWSGAFVDESEQMVLVLSDEGGRLEGVLLDQADGTEYDVEGTLGEDTIEGALRRGGQRHSFSGRLDGDVMVIISGRTTSRWRRTPGSRRAAAGLRELRQARMKGNEAAAIGGLKVLTTSQTLFREADKEADGQLDYGTLEELAATQLIDAALGSGTKQGYRFAVRVSPEHPEFLWMATATPVEPGRSGGRFFVVNHAGVIYYSSRAPFALDDSCEIPSGATPVGRPERPEAATAERPAPPIARRPDLSHVKVGQRYRYRLTTPGTPPMDLIYTVLAVDGLTVKYESSVIMDVGRGPQPVGPPTPQEWRYKAPAADQRRRTPEQVTISGVRFDCMVVTVGTTSTWVPWRGDLPTFPDLLRTTTDGQVTMELVAIEEAAR